MNQWITGWNCTVQKLKRTNTLSKKFFIKTFGCQMNEYDSDRISDLTKGIGYIKAEDINNIDCYIEKKSDVFCAGNLAPFLGSPAWHQ